MRKTSFCGKPHLKGSYDGAFFTIDDVEQLAEGLYADSNGSEVIRHILDITLKYCASERPTAAALHETLHDFILDK